MKKDSLNIELLVKYWLDSSEEELKTMNNLFNSGDYNWSLFLGHLVLEKLLKALYVKKMMDTPPFTHDLLRLAQLTGIEPDEEKSEKFDTISSFNINSRYDDYKQQFRKICTPEFTENWLKEIKDLRNWLIQQL